MQVASLAFLRCVKHVCSLALVGHFLIYVNVCELAGGVGGWWVELVKDSAGHTEWAGLIGRR